MNKKTFSVVVTRPTIPFVIIGLLAFAGCKSAPSKNELDQLIDARLAERGLAPLPSASGSSSSSASPSASASAAVQKANEDPSAASLAFLTRLDDLMKDYAPQLPAVEDKSDVLRCVTSDAAKNSPDLQKVASALKQRADAAKQERKRKESDFYKAVYPLAFHYDLDWQTRGTASVLDTYGCWEMFDGDHSMDGWDVTGNDDAVSCAARGKGLQSSRRFAWKLKTRGHPPQFVYSGTETASTPELMRRIAAAAIILPARFSCRVDDVMSETGHKTVKCLSSGTVASLRISGDLKVVNTGDLVSVPFADTKRDPDGVLFKNTDARNAGWVVDADGAALTVDAAATCPSMDEILATLGNPSAK